MSYPELDKIAKVIAENLPSPYAIDDVWRQTKDGAEFDLCGASGDNTVEQWRTLASAVLLKTAEFTPDEIETIKLVLAEWGFEYSLRADAEKVDALCNKLGIQR